MSLEDGDSDFTEFFLVFEKLLYDVYEVYEWFVWGKLAKIWRLKGFGLQSSKMEVFLCGQFWFFRV